MQKLAKKSPSVKPPATKSKPLRVRSRPSIRRPEPIQWKDDQPERVFPKEFPEPFRAADKACKERIRNGEKGDVLNLNMARTIMREWRPAFSLVEFEVICWIYDRTYLWDKLTETIYMKHFTEGVYDRETGELKAAPLPYERRSMNRILNRLEKVGVLFKAQEHERAAAEYGLNPDWQPDIAHSRYKHWKNRKSDIGK